MHPNNKHNNGYDFNALIDAYPKLKDFVFKNKHETLTIKFADPKAVKALNKALMFHYYKWSYWDFPDANLCPAIPGRVDYIHHLNALILNSSINDNKTILDVGTGASCVYPLLGNAEYDWSFVASDIDKQALKNAQEIIDQNSLNSKIELRHQKDDFRILKGIIQPKDRFTASLCNPPFYKSEEEATKATSKKLKGLGLDASKTERNFSGKSNELWYKGGEKAFLHNYIYESALYKEQCFWFTSLVSNKDHVRPMKVLLKKLKATAVKTINMTQGQKVSRILAWTFLTDEQQQNW